MITARLKSSYLDVTVEDGLGESLERGTLVHCDAGLGVEQRDSRRVPGQGSGVRVTEDLEVVVDSVSNHHLPTEQLQDLQTQKSSADVPKTFAPYFPRTI